MSDYNLIKPYRDELLQAGMSFLKRSGKANGTAKGVQGDELNNLHPHNDTKSVREYVNVMLMKAVKENDRHLSQINYDEDGFFKKNQSRKRRGAVCEEDVLERDGLLKLLKSYSKLMIFHEIYSLF